MKVMAIAQFSCNEVRQIEGMYSRGQRSEGNGGQASMDGSSEGEK
jgi:hypothetical protein